MFSGIRASPPVCIIYIRKKKMKKYTEVHTVVYPVVRHVFHLRHLLLLVLLASVAATKYRSIEAIDGWMDDSREGRKEKENIL